MSKTKQGSNAQFTSAGRGLTVIGNHCYAYSGDVAVSGSSTTMLEFTTGKQYIIAKIEQHGLFAQIGQNQISIEVTINGVSVLHTFWEAQLDSTYFDSPTELLIPPLSSVVVYTTQASGSDKVMQITLTGRVYG